MVPTQCPLRNSTRYLVRVRHLHETKHFADSGGQDPFFRMALMAEEVGEIARCLSTGEGDLAEEHADLLIVLLGNAISFGIDLFSAAHHKLDRLDCLEPKLINGHSRIVTREAPQ